MLRLSPILTCVALSILPLAAMADESVSARARMMYERHSESIVMVTAATQTRLSAPANPGMNLPEQENKVRTEGTIVDRNGLVVLSLSAIDPSRLIDGREQNLPPPIGTYTFGASSSIKEIEIILGDATEIPATLVFRDVDLDLAFIRPKTDAPEAKGVTFSPIDLASSGSAQVADYTVTIARQTFELFNNVEAVAIGNITSVIERPRPAYLGANLVRGCPTFTLDGKLLGIGAFWVSKTQDPGLALVPAAAVLKAMGQIPKNESAPAATN